MLELNSRGEDVRTLQENLKLLGFQPGPVDGDFGEKTENAVISFQEMAGLLPDGIVGSRTQAALEKMLSDQILEQQSLGVDSLATHPDRLPFTRVPADKSGDGYDRFVVRSDVAEAYMNVREEVLEAGGILASSGGKRSLTAYVGPSRSATSFHYTGRALDLHVGSGMERLASDPYVIASDGDRYWRIFARAPGGDAMEIDAFSYASRVDATKVSGNFLDLTAIFEKHGFSRIRARKSFFNGGHWLGAEWWHFQYEVGLEAGVSTFGEELLRVYSEETLRPTPPWQYRERIFGVNWF